MFMRLGSTISVSKYVLLPLTGKNASLWAQKSFEANATAMGEKHSLKYKNYVANPRSHPAASMKQRATLTGPP